jgi:type I restriction enzyme S subunit
MSLLAYQEMKPSGIEYSGEIPSDWSLKRLGDLVAFAQGKAHEPYIDDDGDYICVNSRFVSTSGKTIKTCSVNLTPASLNDILMVMSDLPNGRALARAYYVDDHGKYAVNQRVCRITAEKAHSRFLFYLLDRHPGLMQNDDGVHQTHLSNSDFQKLKLYLPSLSEQNQIARFLDHETARIDALIEEQQRLIELLKEKRQAVISHAVTKGLDPKVPMKDSGAEWLGEVPAHWETLRIGAVYSEAADKGLAELPVLRVSIHHGVSDKELSEEESDRKITRIDDREKYKRVRPGDLVYNMMRAWQGGFGAVLVDGLVSPAYVVARPKNEDISRYVEQLLRTGCAVEEMRKNSYGITDFRLRLYWDQFKNIVIVIPPEVERQQIMERIDSLINESEALKSEADRLIVILQERRSALISAAVTGKIDVRGWQPPARAQAPVLEAEAV